MDRPTSSPALFLDRDGVLNQRIDNGYVTDVSTLSLLDVTLPAVRLANQMGVAVVVVTNQGAIGRRLLSVAALDQIHDRLLAALAEQGARVDGIYVCPHHPGAVAATDRDCSCRKPAPGLLLRAASELNIDLATSIMVGDQPSDYAAAIAAGLPQDRVVILDDQSTPASLEGRIGALLRRLGLRRSRSMPLLTSGYNRLVAYPRRVWRTPVRTNPRRTLPVSTSELSIPPYKDVRVRDIGPQPDPAYVSPGRSALHHPILVLLLTVVGLVAGGAVAYQRAPVWKAQSRLIVGTTVNLTNPSATPGLAAAETQIASNYSRLVGTATVSDGVKRRLGHPAAGSLTATPVPQSALIVVTATGRAQSDATALAAAGQAALVDAVNVVNQQTAVANAGLFNQYQSASSQLAKDTVNLSNLQQQQSLLQSEINSLQSSINSLSASSFSSSSRTQAFQAQIAANQQQLAAMTPELVAANTAVSVDKFKTQTPRRSMRQVTTRTSSLRKLSRRSAPRRRRAATASRIWRSACSRGVSVDWSLASPWRR